MSQPTGRSIGSPSWAALIGEWTQAYVESVPTLTDIPAAMADSTPEYPAGDRLGGFSATTAAVIILAGAAPARQCTAMVAPHLARAVRDVQPPTRESQRLAAYWTLSQLNAAECIGEPVEITTASLAAEWMPALASRADAFQAMERHTLALMACAIGPVSDVRRFATDGRQDAFAADRTFGLNVPAFAGYLADAITAQAAYPDIELSWLEFVHNFPLKFETRMLDWPALLWAARAVYCTIGGLPVAEVGDELHRLVTGA